MSRDPRRRFRLLGAKGLLTCSLLAIATCGCARSGSSGSDPGSEGATGPAFSDASLTSGLDFRHENGMQGELWFVEMMGAGAALFDYDRDGDLDAWLLQGGPLGPSPSEPGRSDRLFRNELDPAIGPDSLRFVDVSAEAGIAAATGYGMGIAIGDVDRDGWPDVYLANDGPNQLWRNRGDGGFELVDGAAGAQDERWSTGAAFLDFDRDGWQDLMVISYVAYRVETDHACHDDATGRRDYCGPHAYPAEPDRLFRNRGDGRFEDRSQASGILAAYGPGLGLIEGDVDGDGWPDLLVANDGQPNQLWMNRDGRRFEDEAALRGAAVNRVGVPEGDMGVVLADLDRDCSEDLFITHFDREMNTLWLNDGRGYFVDRTQGSGLGPASLPFTGFGTVELDFDGDGFLDLFVANGAVNQMVEQVAAGEALPLAQTGQLFRGLGEGRFEDLSDRGGSYFGELLVGRGAALGDVDNDGDADLLVTHNHGPARLLLGSWPETQAWIGLEPRESDGRSAEGSLVELLLPGREAGHRCGRVRRSGSYASARDPRLRFALPDAETAASVLVTWPDGSRERFENLPPGAYHILHRAAGIPDQAP